MSGDGPGPERGRALVSSLLCRWRRPVPSVIPCFAAPFPRRPSCSPWGSGGALAPAGAAGACTRTLGPGARLARTVARAPGGAVVCLRACFLPDAAPDRQRPSPHGDRPPGGRGGARHHVRLAGVRLQRVSGLRIEGLRLTGRVSVVQSGSAHPAGRQRHRGDPRRRAGDRRRIPVRLGPHAAGRRHRHPHPGQRHPRHGLACGRAGGPADGYGIVMAGNHARITVRGNTIRDVAVDSIQSSGGDDLVVDGNPFEGPGHSGAHPGVHADL